MWGGKRGWGLQYGLQIFELLKVYRALGSRLTNPFLWKGSCCPSTFKGSLFTEAPSYSVRVSLW